MSKLEKISNEGSPFGMVEVTEENYEIFAEKVQFQTDEQDSRIDQALVIIFRRFSQIFGGRTRFSILALRKNRGLFHIPPALLVGRRDFVHTERK